MEKQIKTALVSVFSKDGLDPIIKLLDKNGVKIISTGGTADYIKKLGVKVTEVEEITGFPSVFGGRVKTLQPQIFGGILNRRDNEEDKAEKAKHNIEDIDLVIVDLYPFFETLTKGGTEEEIVEKIDIGGVSLIRAAAKNFNDVVVVPSKKQYAYLQNILEKGTTTTIGQRKHLASCAFEVTGGYDMTIWSYFAGSKLRYGENPHQSGQFIGDMTEAIEILQGKELSYNNLLDTDSAIRLIKDFTIPAFAILKHTNACGCATGSGGTLELLKKAYTTDPVSAFGGILVTNQKVDADAAKYLVEEVKLFFEVLIAPEFTSEALEVLSKKTDIRVLKLKDFELPMGEIRTCLNGYLSQFRDAQTETKENFTTVTKRAPTETEINDMVIGATIAKHLKSNCVVIVKDGNMITMGAGQVSRVDALKNALEKAKGFGLAVKGGILASEAFLPFPDCVEISGNAGVTAVVQPGGSKKDQLSIDKCNELNMAMVVTGFRHFKH
jgi:phosphoribosylaminoimidazolecarboxamide formyltransferase/IMP cyclohydrolase